MERLVIIDDCRMNKPNFIDPQIEEIFTKGRHIYPFSVPSRPTDEAYYSEAKLNFPKPNPINNDELPNNIDIIGKDMRRTEQRDFSDDKVD